MDVKKLVRKADAPASASKPGVILKSKVRAGGLNSDNHSATKKAGVVVKSKVRAGGFSDMNHSAIRL